ncbi:MAG: hypothetical protein PF443_08425, partial [Allgaiera sp.]|nr:hypothetical protein [Allgaiera sp.]
LNTVSVCARVRLAVSLAHTRTSVVAARAGGTDPACARCARSSAAGATAQAGQAEKPGVETLAIV